MERERGGGSFSTSAKATLFLSLSLSGSCVSIIELAAIDCWRSGKETSPFSREMFFEATAFEMLSLFLFEPVRASNSWDNRTGESH